MNVFELTLKYEAIGYVTETSFKMASKNSQKWLTIFGQKVKISPACGSNTYQIMYRNIYSFQCQL